MHQTDALCICVVTFKIIICNANIYPHVLFDNFPTVICVNNSLQFNRLS